MRVAVVAMRVGIDIAFDDMGLARCEAAPLRGFLACASG